MIAGRSHFLIKHMEDHPEHDEFTMADELVKKWSRSERKRSNLRFQAVFRTFLVILFLAIVVFLTYILITLLIDRMGWWFAVRIPVQHSLYPGKPYNNISYMVSDLVFTERGGKKRPPLFFPGPGPELQFIGFNCIHPHFRRGWWYHSPGRDTRFGEVITNWPEIKPVVVCFQPGRVKWGWVFLYPIQRSYYNSLLKTLLISGICKKIT